MKLSELKSILSQIPTVRFKLPSGAFVPSHFHVTEVGKITKNFVDCGGTVRNEETINFQLWTANDTDHQLEPSKLLSIIHLSEKIFELPDVEIEVEYQNETIQKFGLDYQDNQLLLINKQTDCLSKDQCGIPEEKPKFRIKTNQTSCTPNSGCC
jgi:hypothetical protein